MTVFDNQDFLALHAAFPNPCARPDIVERPRKAPFITAHLFCKSAMFCRGDLVTTDATACDVARSVSAPPSSGRQAAVEGGHEGPLRGPAAALRRACDRPKRKARPEAPGRARQSGWLDRQPPERTGLRRSYL